MINRKSVRQAMVETLNCDSSTLMRFDASHLPDCMMTKLNDPLSAELLWSALTNAAAECLSISRLLIDDISSGGDTAPQTAYSRFCAMFYLLIQASYCEVISEFSGPTVVREVSHNWRKDKLDLKPTAKILAELGIQISEAEVGFYLSIEPSVRKSKLSEVYGKFVAGVLEIMSVGSNVKQSIVKMVTTDSQNRLKVTLATPVPSYNWMRNYLALSIKEQGEENLVSGLAAINDSLAGWKNLVSNTRNELAERWKSYRGYLKGLPDQKESMYNEDFGVGKVFIMPQITYHRVGTNDYKQSPEIAPDLARLLGALVSNRLDCEDLIILCGGPGSGKSTLCRMFASELAKDEDMHPVFLRLRRCKEGGELAPFLEETLMREGVISRMSDLQHIPNLVLILDGFDELVLASTTRLRHFFSVLLDDLRSGPLRKARVIISGRDTLFPKGEGLPRGSHVLSVQPFNKDRISLWGDKWRTIHTRGSGVTFRPEVLVQETASKKKLPLHHLVAWPLTLHLLARLHTAGLLDISSANNLEIEKAYLYRGILRETAKRQRDQTEGKGRLESELMRDFLRALAWEMYTRSVDSMDPSDVIPLAKKYFPGHDESAIAELTEVAIVNAPEIQKGEDTGFEFVHKSFSEYLVAERMAQTIEEVSYKVEDLDGQRSWRRDIDAAISRCASVFGVRQISVEVQEMLEPMLGCFSQFRKGEKVGERVPNTNYCLGLLNVQERFQELYGEFVTAKSIFSVYEPARAYPVVKTAFDSYANYGTAIVIIGTAATRRLRATKEFKDNPGFCIDSVDGSLWRYLCILYSGGIQVDRELSSRLYDGSTLKRPGKTSDVSDWASPIKLGFLAKIDGYRSILTEEQHQILGQINSILNASLALAVLLEGSEDKQESAMPADRSGVLHFARHAQEIFLNLRKQLIMNLARGGIALNPSISEAEHSTEEILRELSSLLSERPAGVARTQLIGALERIFCGGPDLKHLDIKSYLNAPSNFSRQTGRSVKRDHGRSIASPPAGEEHD